MTALLVLLMVAVLIAGLLNVHRLPRLRETLVARRAERVVERRHAHYLRLLRTGQRGARTERVLHNDFDAACVNWWGDRSPERNDFSNREFGGAGTRTDLRRCLLCRPLNDDECDVVRDVDLFSFEVLR